MSAVIPDPATTDWVPLWNLGAPSGLVMVEDKLLAADGPISFQNIPATYKSLLLVGQVRSNAAALTDTMLARMNGDATAVYDSGRLDSAGAAAPATVLGTGATSISLGVIPGATAVRANLFATIEIKIPNYLDATEKSLLHQIGYQDPGQTSARASGQGNWRSTAAINRFDLLLTTGTAFKAGSHVTLYALTDVGSAGALPPYYGATPPTNPQDGQEWILPVDAANGVMWHFRYNGSSGSAYKWEFIGGASVQKTGTDATINATGGSVVANTSFTVARAGDYEIDLGAFMQNTGPWTSAYDAFTMLRKNAVNFDPPGRLSFVVAGQFNGGSVAMSLRITLAAADVLDLIGAVSAAVNTDFKRAYLKVLPVRVA